MRAVWERDVCEMWGRSHINGGDESIVSPQRLRIKATSASALAKTPFVSRRFFFVFFFRSTIPENGVHPYIFLFVLILFEDGWMDSENNPTDDRRVQQLGLVGNVVPSWDPDHQSGCPALQDKTTLRTVNRRFPGTVNTAGKRGPHTDADAVVIANLKIRIRECRLAVSNHTVTRQFADSACSVCKVKAKAEAAYWPNLPMSLMRDLCV